MTLGSNTKAAGQYVPETIGQPNPGRWAVLVILGLASIASVGTILSPVTLVGEVAKGAGLSMGQALMATMGTIDASTALAGFLGGFLADRFGVGRIWMVSLLILIAASLSTIWFGESLAGLILIRIVHGCGAGPIIATSPMLAAQWFPPSERGMVMGAQGTMVSLGAVLSLTFVPWVFSSSGDWRLAMASFSLFPLIALGGAFLLAYVIKPAGHGAPPPPPGELSAGATLRRSLVWSATWALILCNFLFSWQVRTFNDMVPGYLAVAGPAGLGLGPQEAGQLMAIVQVVFGLGPLVGGLLTDKLFSGRVLPVMLLGAVLAAVGCHGLGWQAVHASPGLLMTMLFLAGAGMSMVLPQVMTFVTKCYPERLIGRLGGILMGCGVLGGFSGVSVCSLALHVTGGYAWVLGVMAFLPLAGVVMALFLLRPLPQDAPDSAALGVLSQR